MKEASRFSPFAAASRLVAVAEAVGLAAAAAELSEVPGDVNWDSVWLSLSAVQLLLALCLGLAWGCEFSPARPRAAGASFYKQAAEKSPRIVWASAELPALALLAGTARVAAGAGRYRGHGESGHAYFVMALGLHVLAAWFRAETVMADAAHFVDAA